MTPRLPNGLCSHEESRLLSGAGSARRRGVEVIRKHEFAAAIAGEPAGRKITVTDNGIGIRTENLTRIFSHGFTTRKDGHGFGLHSAAPGRGASFSLELPRARMEVAA